MYHMYNTHHVLFSQYVTLSVESSLILRETETVFSQGGSHYMYIPYLGVFCEGFSRTSSSPERQCEQAQSARLVSL